MVVGDSVSLLAREIMGGSAACRSLRRQAQHTIVCLFEKFQSILQGGDGAHKVRVVSPGESAAATAAGTENAVINRQIRVSDLQESLSLPLSARPVHGSLSAAP